MARTLENLQKRYNKAAVEKRGMGGMGGGMGGGRGRGGMQRAVGKPKNTKAAVRRLFGYILPYRLRLIMVLLCMLGSTVASLIGSYALRPIINNAVDATKTVGERVADLGQMILLLAVIYAVGIVCSYLQARIMLSVSQNATEQLRNDLFNRLQMLPVRYFDNQPTGEIMSRFTNDVDNIDTMLNNTLTALVSGAITLIGTIGFMIATNIWLTLVTVAFVPIFLGCGKRIATASRKYYVGQQAALGAVNGYIQESVSGQKVVKVFNHESECVEEFELLNDDMRDKQYRAQFFGGIMGPIMFNTSEMSYAITAGVGGLLCLHAGLDVGGLSIFAGYARHFSMPINSLSQQTSVIFAALAGAERVFTVMDQTPEADRSAEPDRTPETLRGEVVLDRVTFGYNAEKPVLHEISLTAKPGQKIAFVGSTGAGKTTVTNLINRFYEIDSGAITVDGIDIRQIDRAFLRKNVAMVLQDTHLFTGTVMENIRYGRLDATDAEVIAAAKTASAHSFITRLENGYNTVLEGDGANLSQGQRQLLNIARAALSKAPILVLDEATSSVDTRTERHIEQGMDALMTDRTTFVIAHRLSTVRNSDQILVLEQGRIVERGNHAELLAQKGRYYELYTGKRELD